MKIRYLLCAIYLMQLSGLPAIDTSIIDTLKTAIRDTPFDSYKEDQFDIIKPEKIRDEFIEKFESSPNELAMLIRFIFPKGLVGARRKFLDKERDAINQNLIENVIAPLKKFSGNPQIAQKFVDTYLQNVEKRISEDKTFLKIIASSATFGEQSAIDTINRYLTAASLWELEKSLNGPHDSFDFALDISESFEKDTHSKNLMNTSLYQEAISHTIKNNLEQLVQALKGLR
jgi:hypothetical protein